jgi:hypothetical protein
VSELGLAVSDCAHSKLLVRSNEIAIAEAFFIRDILIQCENKRRVIMNDQKKVKPKLTLAQIQEEAAKHGVKVIEGSARFKAIGIVGGVASRQREAATSAELSKDS